MKTVLAAPAALLLLLSMGAASSSDEQAAPFDAPAAPSEPPSRTSAAEDAVNRISEQIARKEDLVGRAQERLDAALKRQEPAYSTVAEADTAAAMLAVVEPLLTRNAALLAGYRELFQIRQGLREDLKSLPQHCEELARQYEAWAGECPIADVKKNYQAMADVWRARAAEAVDQAKEVLSEYDPETERFLEHWGLFLSRMKTSLERYPPIKLNKLMRLRVLEDLKAHVRALDGVSRSVQKWRDVSREQSRGAGPAAAARPEPGPRAEGPTPTAAAPAYRRSADDFLARNSWRLRDTTPGDLPRLRAEYGLNAASGVPYYSASGLAAGDVQIRGHVHANYKMGREGVYLVEKTSPGLEASRAPADFVILRTTADLAALAATAREFAPARPTPAGAGGPGPRVASSRP